MTASERLAELLRLGSNTAVIVFDPSNMFYLTEGYTGEGLVFISRERRAVVTDFRYTEQAENQAPGFEVLMTAKDRSEFQVIAELVRAEGITCVKTETNYLSVDRFGKLRAGLGDEVSCTSLEEAPQKLRQIKTPSEILAIRRACSCSAMPARITFSQIRGCVCRRIFI